MVVHIEQRGVCFVPYKVVSPELGMKLANKAKWRTDEGVYYRRYACKAENGIEKIIDDFDVIPDGDYNLNDADWQVPNEVGVNEEEW